MALYDDFLNQNNLYSRPASMMSDVNDYLGANRASLPMDANSLGSLMNNTGLNKTNDELSFGGIAGLRGRDDTIDGDPDPTDPTDSTDPTDPPSPGGNPLLE